LWVKVTLIGGVAARAPAKRTATVESRPAGAPDGVVRTAPVLPNLITVARLQ